MIHWNSLIGEAKDSILVEPHTHNAIYTVFGPSVFETDCMSKVKLNLNYFEYIPPLISNRFTTCKDWESGAHVFNASL